MKTKWTQEQVDDFHEWHENRMDELDYPDKLKRELRETRMHWIAQVKIEPKEM